MASTISIDDIKHVAALAKIAVTDAEIASLQCELDEILGYVQQLDGLDTAGVEPTFQVTGLKNVMREDEIIDYNVPQAELLKNVPQVQDGQIKVPKVL
ncbi:MAG TPA: Asp-tRNA(Asn)/Glu-tRNA(Gln) amidotransferase subunit GatC [Candidatus Acidoferrum sp.]|nr:Asp-tRNA(Asn)/Glu-tRNA(Gln) amidotransferase subunit GatC [Candidatus Acidoferrum sp.]